MGGETGVPSRCSACVVAGEGARGLSTTLIRPRNSDLAGSWRPGSRSSRRQSTPGPPELLKTPELLTERETRTG